MLGVAKDLGDSIGFIAGSLCEVLPIWAILCIGVVQNFVGYGLVWLIVTQKLPALPLWVVSLSLSLSLGVLHICKIFYLFFVNLLEFSSL